MALKTAAESVVKYGLPVPDAKITIRFIYNRCCETTKQRIIIVLNVQFWFKVQEEMIKLTTHFR